MGLKINFMSMSKKRGMTAKHAMPKKASWILKNWDLLIIELKIWSS